MRLLGRGIRPSREIGRSAVLMCNSFLMCGNAPGEIYNDPQSLWAKKGAMYHGKEDWIKTGLVAGGAVLGLLGERVVKSKLVKKLWSRPRLLLSVCRNVLRKALHPSRRRLTTS